MFPPELFRASLEKCASVLQQHRIRFHLTGGLTSVAYGEARLTLDVDIVVDPAQLLAALEDTLEEFRSQGFVFDLPAVKQAIAGQGMFQLFDKREALKLDVYPRELIPGELNRSVLVEVFSGLTLPIVSRVDSAGAKLIWINKGSHKSRRDLKQIFRISSDEERLGINRLAEQFQLSELLEVVLNEPDEIQ